MGAGNSRGNEIVDKANHQRSERITQKKIDDEIDRQIKDQKEEYPNKVLKVTNCKSKCQKPHKLALEKVGYADFDSTPIQENSLGEGKVLKKIIPGRDGRIRVNETRQWPHSVHGLLSMKFDNSPVPYTGTATMIGPNIAITAAHNLYHFETKTEVKASDVYFYPAANDHLLPFGAVKVQAFYYPEEYKTTKKEDYALLILEHDIGEQTGYFGLHAIERPDIEGKMVNITGYPADKVVDYPKQHQMWGMEGPMSHLDADDDLMSYEIDTYAGQSGSGIWYDAEDEYYVVGVHVHCYDIYNQGTFLNKKRVERIREWILSFYARPGYEQLLRSLDLRWKDIGDKGAEHLSKANLPHLQSLCLYSNQIGYKGAEYLCKAKFPQLQTLDLSRNQIGDKGAEYLSKLTLPQLQSLNLSHNQIGDKGVEYLSKATFRQLQSLNLSDNQIVDKGAEYLSKANFLQQLQSLYLSNNQIGDTGTEYLSKAIFPQLQLLYLDRNQIGNKGAEYLSKAIFLQLQSLNLYNNQIGEKGAEYLSKANFPLLQSLDLSSNQIRDNGAECLSKANFPHLQSLILYYNQIGESGAEHLSKANFPQLQSLNLYNNQLGEKGAEYLSRATLPQLQLLYLSWNKFGDKGAEHLSKANFPQLQLLDLSYNQIGDNGAENMSKANFSQLQTLDLSHNQIGEKGAQFLLFMKSHHPNFIRLTISY